ncbi:hypothetical protein [Kaarinaea lacus]
MKSFTRSIVNGIVIFVTIVAGGTYYLQSSLILVKNYNPHTHWAAILLALPVIAGVAHRITKIRYPFTNVLLGTLTSALILYPQYKKLWAIPPTTFDVSIYIIIVFGIGYIATQPIKTTFMMAFRLGRYSISKISESTKRTTKSTKAGKSTSTSNSNIQPNYDDQGHTLAMLELTIGICSLALSIFSVFFMGNK